MYTTKHILLHTFPTPRTVSGKTWKESDHHQRRFKPSMKQANVTRLSANALCNCPTGFRWKRKAKSSSFFGAFSRLLPRVRIWIRIQTNQLAQV